MNPPRYSWTNSSQRCLHRLPEQTKPCQQKALFWLAQLTPEQSCCQHCDTRPIVAPPPPGFLQLYAETNIAFRAKTKRRKQVAQRGNGLAGISPSNLSEAVDGLPPFFSEPHSSGWNQRQPAAVGPSPSMGSRGGAEAGGGRCDALPDPTAGCTAPSWAPHPEQCFQGNRHVPRASSQARGALEPAANSKRLRMGKLQNILGGGNNCFLPCFPRRENSTSLPRLHLSMGLRHNVRFQRSPLSITAGKKKKKGNLP